MRILKKLLPAALSPHNVCPGRVGNHGWQTGYHDLDPARQVPYPGVSKWPPNSSDQHMPVLAMVHHPPQERFAALMENHAKEQLSLSGWCFDDIRPAHLVSRNHALGYFGCSGADKPDDQHAPPFFLDQPEMPFLAVSRATRFNTTKATSATRPSYTLAEPAMPPLSSRPPRVLASK